MGDEMRRPLSNVTLVATLVTALGCIEETVVADGLTGLELTVRYESSLELDQLLFTVTRSDGAVLLGPQRRPEVPAPLASDTSTVVILLPEVLADHEISIRIDGMETGQLVASGSIRLLLIGRVLVELEVTLGDPLWCGDGVTSAPFEECDDGNNDDDDGCDGHCDVERGHGCQSLDENPSVCGDGICCIGAGESPCDCPEDCGADICGDGCCSGTESPVDCAEDCGRCTGACRGGTCMEPCAGPNCTLNCAGDCGCAIDCTDANKCIPTCTFGASCSIDCTGAGQCMATCSAGADCDIDCTDSENCGKPRCEGSSQCSIVCTGAGTCGFAVCDGVQTSCPGNVLVCNRDCPP